MEGKAIVEVEELRKSYGPVTAVDGISLEVYEGEIFGMVGPNGAGKTTTIECLEGLRRADSGEIRVLGCDPQRDGYALRPRIGVQLQEAMLQDRIRVWEALHLFAGLYANPVDWEPLLTGLGLAESRNVAFAKLSGGQKQRLFVALALVNDPELVFLDELTTGLDPQGRRAIWDLVRGVRDRGKTVLLTTHFMEEAERLCDRVAIIEHGRIVALDSPENLIREFGAESRVVFTAAPGLDLEVLEGLSAVARTESIGDRVIVHGHGDELVVQVVNALSASGTPIRDLRTEQPNLEDVFLALTGRAMRE